MFQHPGEHKYSSVVLGWARAAEAAGYSHRVLGPNDVAFDEFFEFRPQVFVETRPRTRAVDRCLAEWKRVKVVDHLEIRPAFDALGMKKADQSPCFRSNFVFIGTRRPDNAAKIDEYLDAIAKKGRIVKIFGAGDWSGYPNHLGWVTEQEKAAIYASARKCLDLSVGNYSERYLQIVGLGGVVVSACVRDHHGRSERRKLLWEFVDDVLDADHDDMPSGKIVTYSDRLTEMLAQVGL